MSKGKRIVFFDTETTGNMEQDVLCQIAYKHGEENFVCLYNPGKKIPPEASAVHHITNKMVADKEAFRSSQHHPTIKELFEHPDTVVVAHNAPFDLGMLKKEGIEPANYICTLRVARHLDKEGKIDRYNLQYLRYLLEIDVDAQAHDAMGDVVVLEKLFERLKNKLVEEDGMTEEEAIEEMIKISSHPSLLRTFHFGKHNGRKIADVLATDRDYLEWLLNQKLQSGDKDEDWIYTLEHHLGKNKESLDF